MVVPWLTQAVNRRPLTAVARSRSLVSPCGICGGQSDTGKSLSSSSTVFTCQYHSTVAPHSYIICWMNRPLVAAVQGHGQQHTFSEKAWIACCHAFNVGFVKEDWRDVIRTGIAQFTHAVSAFEFWMHIDEIRKYHYVYTFYFYR
jgi:hypothetical protein